MLGTITRIRETYNCTLQGSPSKASAIALVDRMSGWAPKDVAAMVDCQEVRVQVDKSRAGLSCYPLGL